MAEPTLADYIHVPPPLHLRHVRLSNAQVLRKIGLCPASRLA